MPGIHSGVLFVSFANNSYSQTTTRTSCVLVCTPHKQTNKQKKQSIRLYTCEGNIHNTYRGSMATTSTPALPADHQEHHQKATGGDTQELGFGKHRKRTYQWVRENTPTYCRWAKRQGFPSPALSAFLDWLEEVDGTGTLMGFGAHAHQTRGWVVRHNPGYVLSARRLSDPKPDVKSFLDSPEVRTINWNAAFARISEDDHREVIDGSDLGRLLAQMDELQRESRDLSLTPAIRPIVSP